MSTEQEILDRVRRLKVFRHGDRRAPHKPLLLLIAISQLLQGKREVSDGEVEARLRPVLEAYAPPVRARHQPELPYWHLRSDGLWEVTGADTFARQAGGFPRMEALRQSSGHLPDEVAAAFQANPTLVAAVVQQLLDAHFPTSLHDDILDAVGLPALSASADSAPEATTKRRRDPAFRERILRAYEHQCAVTGFRAALSGVYFGCEAAHVKWHAYEGPDTTDNGFAVEPTLHKLFDAGAWSLTDDRRVLVSAEFTGSDEAIVRLRQFHGRALRVPLLGEPAVSIEHIRWHREPELGGVFRLPALPL